MTGSRRNPLLRFLTWLGGNEMGLLLAVAGIAAGIWVFAEIADHVIGGGTQHFDRAVLLAMRHADKTPLGPPWVQETARDVTALGSVTVLSLITIGVFGFFALDDKMPLALFTAGSVVSGLMVSSFLKHLFHRPRPDLVPWSVYVQSTSFPSGHSMLSAVTYLTLGALLARTQQRRMLKAWFMLCAVFLTVAVGVSRVYLAVHWPTDVLAGWTAGAVWSLVCWLVARRLQNRQALSAAHAKDI